MTAGPDLPYMLEVLPKLLKTVPYTLLIIGVSGIASLVLAAGIACIRIRKVRILDPLAAVYVSFFRSTPSIIHLFLLYYGLPLAVLPLGIDIRGADKSLFAISALVLFNGAFVSEYLRPAYLAIDRGQHDAAESIGMTGFQKIRRVVLSQALPIALPGLGNALIELIKDTSILFTIGLIDIMGRAKLIIGNDYGVKKLEIFLAAGLIYWTLNFLADRGVKLLEKKFRTE